MFSLLSKCHIVEYEIWRAPVLKKENLVFPFEVEHTHAWSTVSFPFCVTKSTDESDRNPRPGSGLIHYYKVYLLENFRPKVYYFLSR